MRYISVTQVNESINKIINIDDIAYIHNSYMYFLTDRDMRVRNSMQNLSTLIRNAGGVWVGWTTTINNYLHIGNDPIIVIPGSIKDIVGNQIRFKNGLIIRVRENHNTIISMIPPDTSAGGGDYQGSEYIGIQNNIISAITADIDDTQNEGLVTNTNVYQHTSDTSIHFTVNVDEPDELLYFESETI